MRFPSHLELGLALLRHVVPDDDPLVGDLAESAGGRSPWWLWRQVCFVLLLSVMARLRVNGRITDAVTALAIFVVLSFEVVVAGTLLYCLFAVLDGRLAAQGVQPTWWLSVAVLVAAWFVGRTAGRVRTRSRIAAILIYGSSAAGTAWATLWWLHPSPTPAFLPSPLAQLTVAALFIIGANLGARRGLAAPR